MNPSLKSRVLLVLLSALSLSLGAANNQVLGWNNLGMHCMDSDYSVFSVLPPYNTIGAQLIVNGVLVTNGTGYTVTYQAVADPSGSFNSTSVGKGNYADYVLDLYGANVTADEGLLGWNMPGVSNTPQAMLFEVTNQPSPVAHPAVQTKVNWWRAEGIPLSPYDNSHNKNPYPLMRLIAKSGATPIATNDIVLPVSDEMDCRACHASGSVAAAQPAAGWVWDGIQERDFRLNILRLHDEHEFAQHPGLYQAALAARGFNPQGLYRGVVADNHPVLCAKCHDSEALGTGSYSNIPPLTTSLHAYHAHVMDPLSKTTLDSSANRSACYRCHPGSTTKCLRGAMGGAIATDGSMEMQCQSCHGNMSSVGSTNRIGWFMEPNCASCHTGTATSNNGQIRYTSVFTDTNYTVRVAVNQTFSTQPDIPAAGLSLFRFSAGHGGLQCEACHGSTHAEFPSIHANDNVRNINIQGHAGVTVECTACHVSMNANTNNAAAGPHGMHPIGQTWVDNHPDMIEQHAVSRAQCQACHGGTYRGTVLSRAQTTRTVTSKFGTKTFWRGQMIGCYDCHNGANNDNPSTNAPPVVSNVSADVLNDTNVDIVLPGTDANGNLLTFRVVSQPANGAVGISNQVATYFPNPGFAGVDTFTFAANDTFSDSNLGTGSVTVTQGAYGLGIEALVPTNSPSGWPVAFAVVPGVTNYSGAVAFIWNFGDGSPASTNQFPTHVFGSAGAYHWTVTVTAGTAVANTGGSIAIAAPVYVTITQTTANGPIAVTQPIGSVLEESLTLGPGALWTTVTNLPDANGLVMVQPGFSTRFYRARQAW